MKQSRKSHIQKVARQLHREIWFQRERLWPNAEVSVAEIVDPKVACEVLGIHYEEYPEFSSQFCGQYYLKRIAGVLDRQRNLIAIATNSSPQEVRFTAAHEIGHWLLHPNEVMHRDRPIRTHFRNPTGGSEVEQEANYFAACFLMPEKSIVKEFRCSFGTNLPFRFDDEAAFWLTQGNPDRLLSVEKGSLQRQLALASATSFRGACFKSMAERFKVSVEAMAIRIDELGLVSWP